MSTRNMGLIFTGVEMAIEALCDNDPEKALRMLIMIRRNVAETTLIETTAHPESEHYQNILAVLDETRAAKGEKR